MTLASVYHAIRLLREENERLMKLGHPHMNVDEMRFVISAVLGPRGRALFDAEVADIECSMASQKCAESLSEPL